jgi:hypothetical protein
MTEIGSQASSSMHAQPQPYDSRKDTEDHIFRVGDLIMQIHSELWRRALHHDETKLESPEKETFDSVTPKLKELTYGSDEYTEQLKDMKVALDHHYAAYRHHPEHFENGIQEMNLIDVMEMLADWKAATERMDNGNLTTSIYLNAERFGYGSTMLVLLLNTARDMGWLDKGMKLS